MELKELYEKESGMQVSSDTPMVLKDYIEWLEQKAEAGENLKCCGNCKSNDCPERYADSNENACCDKWQSDTLTRDQRTKK